jgi:cytochrome b561
MSTSPLASPVPGYGRITVLLHWLVALLIVAAFALGVVMVDIEGITPSKLRYFSWHKWLGVTVLALAAVRLLWRLTQTAPPYARPMPRWQALVSRLTHGALYVLMFAVPVSGYFYSLSGYAAVAGVHRCRSGLEAGAQRAARKSGVVVVCACRVPSAGGAQASAD